MPNSRLNPNGGVWFRQPASRLLFSSQGTASPITVYISATTRTQNLGMSRTVKENPTTARLALPAAAAAADKTVRGGPAPASGSKAPGNPAWGWASALWRSSIPADPQPDQWPRPAPEK